MMTTFFVPILNQIALYDSILSTPQPWFFSMRKFIPRGIQKSEYGKAGPEFEPGLAAAEAAKLNKFSAVVPEDASVLGWGVARTDFSITSGMTMHLFGDGLGSICGGRNHRHEPRCDFQIFHDL